MILGISGSPRVNRNTDSAVKMILEECEARGEKTEFITLRNKRISGCISCLGCTENNYCVVDDDFREIREAMLNADAIVIGAPNYYSLPNAATHALLERCFCFRHQSAFLLKDKPLVLLSTGYSSDEINSQTLNIMEYFLVTMNKMKLSSRILVGAVSQCYTCYYSKTCVDGNVYKDNGGPVDEITLSMMPPSFKDQPESIKKCIKASENLIKSLKINKIY